MTKRSDQRRKDRTARLLAAAALTLPEDDGPLIPDGAGDLLREMLNPEIIPGPPYTHTLRGEPYPDE